MQFDWLEPRKILIALGIGGLLLLNGVTFRSAYWINYTGILIAKEVMSGATIDPLLYAPGHTLNCHLFSSTDPGVVVSTWQATVSSDRDSTMLRSYLILCGYPDWALQVLGQNTISEEKICTTPQLAYWTGRVYAELGDMPKAIECWKNSPQADFLFAGFGTISRKLGDDASALRYFELASIINDREHSRKQIMYRDLCIIQRIQGKLSEALKNCERYVRFARNGTAYLLLGQVQGLLGDSQSALKSYQQSVALEPRSASAHAGLGGTWMSLGEWNKAEQEYRTAIELDPSYPWAYLNLGDLYYRQGMLTSAVEMYEAVIALGNPLVSPIAKQKLDQVRRSK